MSGSSDNHLRGLERFYLLRDAELENAQYFRTVLKMAYIVEALASGKSYDWIAKQLGQSEAVIRRFHQRYLRRIGPKDYRRVQDYFGITFPMPGGVRNEND